MKRTIITNMIILNGLTISIIIQLQQLKMVMPLNIHLHQHILR